MNAVVLQERSLFVVSRGFSHFLVGSCAVLGSALPDVLQKATFDTGRIEPFVSGGLLMFSLKGCFLEPSSALERRNVWYQKCRPGCRVQLVFWETYAVSQFGYLVHFHAVHCAHYVLTCVVCKFRQGNVVSNHTLPLFTYRKLR